MSSSLILFFCIHLVSKQSSQWQWQGCAIIVGSAVGGHKISCSIEGMYCVLCMYLFVGWRGINY